MRRRRGHVTWRRDTRLGICFFTWDCGLTYSPAGQLSLVECILEALSTITYLDYDLLSQLIPRVLPLLLTVSVLF
jgi:hypothetical protein